MIVEGLMISGSMTLGDALVAGGTFLLAIFGAWSAFEGMRAIRESRDIDRMNVRRAKFHRSREIRGIARLIYQEVESSARIAGEALKAGQWPVVSALGHHAWDVSASLMMEEVDEHAAAALVRLLESVRGWEAYVRLTALVSPGSYSVPVVTGSVPYAVATDAGCHRRPSLPRDAQEPGVPRWTRRPIRPRHRAGLSRESRG